MQRPFFIAPYLELVSKWILKAVYYTVEVPNFDLQEKTTKNNNNTIIAK